MRTFVGMLCLVGLAISFVVHACTFAGYDVLGFGYRIWALHIAFFVIIIPTAALEKHRRSKVQAPPQEPNTYQQWLVTIAAILFVYCMLNFGISAFLLRLGSPTELEDGGFALLNHGDFVRHLTATEYHRFKAYETRLMSGFWLAGYSFAAMSVLVDDQTASWQGASEDPAATP